MTPERRQQIERLFLEAIEREPAERLSFLEFACGNDLALLAHVKSLIAAHEQEGSLIAPVVSDDAPIERSEPRLEALTGHQIGAYQIIRGVGRGGMGDVYLARDTRLRRKVALKILPEHFADDKDRLRRFELEARAASALNHPNIITIFDIGQSGSTHFIATEFIEGETLRQRLAQPHFTASKAIDVTLQVASALTAAHAAGIVHRDIKPENIIIRPDGYVKVLDFGIAKLTERETANWEDQATQATTEAGLLIGTPLYMSPEQARGLKVDARSDIFSLGAVLYEMLEGRAPFQGLTASDLIVAILSSEPPPLTRLAQSVDLQKIVSKALNKDIDQRYQTAGALASDLKALNNRSDADPATSAATGTTVHVSEDQQAATRKAETVGRIDKRNAAPVVSTTHALEATSRRHKLTIIFVLAILIGLAAYFGRTLTRQASKDPNGKIKLAILPFHSVNAPEEVRFLGLGISDAIITRLANVKRMRVRPTSAILRYENQNVDEREAGRTLETDYVLSGTVINAGDRLSVRVQLIQVSDGTPLWGSHYEVARHDLIGLQDSMAERISEALKLHLSAEEQAQVYRRYTDNVAAYEAYLQGRTHLSRYTKEATFAAVSAFETALRFDSSYALADAGLAMASAQISIRFAPATDVKMWADRATSEARRALQLEPNLAEAHEALAAVYRNTEFDWERTIEQSNRALEINPSLEFPHYYRAAAFYHLGVLDAIEREVVLGLEINPLNRAEPLRVRGTAALFGGKFSDAVSFLEEAKRQSENTVTDWYLAQAYYYEGKKALGEEVLAGLHGSAQAEHRAKATLASFLAARGAHEEARKLLREVIAGSYMDHHVAYALGAAYTQLDNFDDAKKWLAQASQTGLPCYPWFERDPLLERLRADVAFQQFLGRMRDLWETAKSRYRAG